MLTCVAWAGLGSISLPPSFVRSLPSANHVTNWGVEWASGRPPKCRRGRRVDIYIDTWGPYAGMLSLCCWHWCEEAVMWVLSRTTKVCQSGFP